jgi:uncharacterized RDD family membrane protein YckC
MDPEYASRPNRLLGQALDAVIGAVPILLIVFGDLFGDSVGIVGVVALVLCVGYYLFADALPGGQSYGKRLLGMVVVDAKTGAPCRVWQSVVRNLTLAFLGPLDWLFIFGARHQRLGDMAAGTIVVQAT